jgi:hypothetical protein
MLDLLGWRSIFMVVLFVEMLAFVLGAVFLSNSSNPLAKGVDWAGASVFTLALAALTYGLLAAPSAGWLSVSVLGAITAAVVMLLIFIAIERSAAHPMLELDLFQYRKFLGVQALATAPAYSFIVLLIVLPIRFVGIERMGVSTSAATMSALSLPLLVLPLFVGSVARFVRPALLCAGGLVIAAGGILWLSFIPVGASSVSFAVPLLLVGCGISLPWGLMDGLAVSVVPKERAGMAIGIFGTTRVAGEGIALAVAGALLASFVTMQLSGVPLTNREIVAASERLATGDFLSATKLLPSVSQDAILVAYGKGFQALLWVLFGMTLLTAAVVFFLLGQAGKEHPTGANLPKTDSPG